MTASLTVSRAHKTFLTKADKILSARLDERFSYEGRVIGAIILQKRSLQLLFVVIGANVYRLHIKRIYTRVVHNRRRCSGGRIIVLNLLGRVFVTL